MSRTSPLRLDLHSSGLPAALSPGDRVEVSVSVSELTTVSALAFGPALLWLVLVAAGGQMPGPAVVQAVTIGAGFFGMMGFSRWLLHRRSAAGRDVLKLRTRRKEDT